MGDDDRRRIAGRYRLEERLGEGTMGAVWRARDLEARRDVAVKVSGGPIAPGPRLRARFEREAALAGGIAHENVVRVLDSGIDEDARPYVVMELLEGEDLDRRLARRPRPSVSDVIGFVAAALDGLAACHDVGVVHRDVKPDNVFLARVDDRIVPKIVDFGVARLVVDDGAGASLTRSGEIVGTPAYMSPEQAEAAKDVGPASDLYSVGVILYEALTGASPYEWDNLGQLILAVATEEPTPPVERRPELGAALSDVVTRAMAKSPADRFEDARAMRAALLAAAVDGLEDVSAAATSLRRRARTLDTAPGTATSDAPELAAAPPPDRAFPLLYVGLGVAVVLSLAAAALAWWA